MKILLFRRDVSAEDGATKVLAWLAKALNSVGHEVVIISHSEMREAPFYPTDPRIKRRVVRLPKPPPHAVIDTSISRFKRKIDRYGKKQYFGYKFLFAYLGYLLQWAAGKARRGALDASGVLRRGIEVLSRGGGAHARFRRENASAIGEITKMLEDERPDVVVSFYTNMTHFRMAEAARLCRIPLICSLHSDPRVYFMRRDLMPKLSSALSPQAVTILDPVFRHDLPRPLQKVAHVIPNHVPNNSVALKEDMREKVILSVGRLTSSKNHALLIDAFAGIASRYPEWRVEIFGEGGLQDTLSEQIAKHGLEGRVQLRGATTDIDSAYARAAIHAFPSLYEGFGLVVIEAMANGLPTIGLAGVYPPATFLRESGAGLLAVSEPEDFAEKLATLIEDAELRNSMGQKALDYAKRYASSEILENWIALLETVHVNGLKPSEAPMAVAPPPADRRPIPEEAAKVEQRKRALKPQKAEGRPAIPGVQIGWTARSAVVEGYPRIHPENIYDALDFLRAAQVRSHNEDVVARIRRKATRGQRIKVGFLVSEYEKWNGDQLIRKLEDSGKFDWSFAICASNRAEKQSPEDRASELVRQREAFTKIGPVEFNLCDAASDGGMPVEDCDFDVVFLQQPWAMKDFPRRLVGRCLCVYMHYGFIMMANHGMHYNIASFHSYLWKYFTQTEMHRQLHLRHDPSAADKLVVTGYPKLDVYREKMPARNEVKAWPRPSDIDRSRVIFAPHHSIQNPRLKMATFPWSAEALAILRDETPDADWIYKPHPTLALSVERAGLMSRAAYEAYVNNWRVRENSAVFDKGGYFDLFRSSDALITDCGSFLAEYLPTGKPIIWLVSESTVGLNEAGRVLAESFYKVHNEAELRSVFRQVVIEGDDTLADKRRRTIEKVMPSAEGASADVVRFLCTALAP